MKQPFLLSRPRLQRVSRGANLHFHLNDTLYRFDALILVWYKSTMKLIIILILSFNFLACQNTPSSNINASSIVAGGKPVYLSSELYEDIKAQISDYPQKGSAAQSVDEFVLRKLQKSRTEKDCERANSEVMTNLQNFYGKPYGSLDEKQINILIPLFDQLRADAGFYIGQIKRNYNRTRPYDYLKDLAPCIPTEKSLSYPSGHSILAVLYALVLSDLFPDKSIQFKDRAEVIAQDRVLAGVHHPSDIVGGKKMGQILYDEVIKSPRYKNDIEKYKKLLIE